MKKGYMKKPPSENLLFLNAKQERKRSCSLTRTTTLFGKMNKGNIYSSRRAGNIHLFYNAENTYIYIFYSVNAFKFVRRLRATFV